jgi:hypothetical protein
MKRIRQGHIDVEDNGLYVATTLITKGSPFFSSYKPWQILGQVIYLEDDTSHPI